MSKKSIIILASLLGGVIVIAAGWFLYQSKLDNDLVSPLGKQEEKVEFSLIDWEDPAGFKFAYPDVLEIDPHEEDEENYAHLELTNQDHSGSILIWMKDTDYEDLDEWLAGEQIETLAFDSELGGEPAKKITYNEPKKIIIAAIDVDVLVLIEVMPEDSWWEEVANQILDSFEFIPLANEQDQTPQPAANNSYTGSGIIEEPEEVLE